MMKNHIREFLKSNGYIKDIIDNQEIWHKAGYSDIDITDDEVVYISDVGDYMHIPINRLTVYTMIGFMLVGRQLDIGFIYNKQLKRGE